MIIGAIITLLVGAAGAYYIYKNLDKIYGSIEYDKPAYSWLWKIAILVDIMLVTGAVGALFTTVPVAAIAMPLVTFTAGVYFFLYKPTTTPKKVSK